MDLGFALPLDIYQESFIMSYMVTFCYATAENGVSFRTEKRTNGQTDVKVEIVI